eukprot:10118782-Alexandrium_andersonii.AAC.1
MAAALSGPATRQGFGQAVSAAGTSRTSSASGPRANCFRHACTVHTPTPHNWATRWSCRDPGGQLSWAVGKKTNAGPSVR